MSTGLELLPLAIAFGAVAGRRRSLADRAEPGTTRDGPTAQQLEKTSPGAEPLAAEEGFAGEEAFAAEEAFPANEPANLVLETRCADQALLVGSLRMRGSHPVVDGVYVHADIDGLPVLFAPTLSGAYDAEFPPGIPLAHAQAAVMDFDETYAREVQREVLARVRRHAAERDMSVEEARTEPDGTTVLTLRHGDLSLRPDGTLAAETRGLYGDECLPFVEVFQELTGARAVDVRYTEDYYTRPSRDRQRSADRRTRRRIDLGEGS